MVWGNFLSRNLPAGGGGIRNREERTFADQHYAPAARGAGRKVLIIVENLPVPFDRRVWMEATTLQQEGYEVSVICPKGKGHDASYEVIDGVHIYRHKLPDEGNGLGGYLAEYGAALFWQFALTLKVLFTRGFHAIHACNPPDLIFLVAAPFRLIGKRFMFDHHDLCPELFEVKFDKQGLLYKAMLLNERLTYALADVSIATNESYRRIAVERGGMAADKVFVVRSGPDINLIKPGPAQPELKGGRTFLVGYLGVIGRQEGLDILVDAAVLLRKQGRDDIQYRIVGGGPELAEIKRYAEQKGVADIFDFVGFATGQTLLDTLNTADICVAPDRMNAMNDHSTMNKIMEYMAVGKPIVQFDLKEGRISAEDASLYAKDNDPADFAAKIALLLDNPELRATMGRSGLDRIRTHLGWDKERGKLLDAYDALFG